MLTLLSSAEVTVILKAFADIDASNGPNTPAELKLTAKLFLVWPELREEFPSLAWQVDRL